jgi:zinc protease
VVVSGYLSVGSVADAEDTAGLAGFTASLLGRGTELRSFDEINETVEGLGASMGFSAGRHVTSFRSKSLAADLELILEVLVDQVRCPTFPPEHVERVRGQWLTDLQERDHDTRRTAGLAFRELIFPGHPYGRSSMGYRETATAISRDDVVDFYRRNYGPQGGVVAVVGAVSADRALALLEDAFDGWQGERADPNEPALPLPPRLETIRRKSVVLPGKTQSDLVLGCVGLARRDPDYYAALVANTVLGRFGMYGRLGANVREKQGLAYYSLSSLEAGVWPGPWYVFAGVNPANVQRAVDSILLEVARMRDEPVPADELNDTKAFLTGSLPLRLETNEGMAGALLEIERHGLGLDYLHRYDGLIRGVTAAQVEAVATRYLDPKAYALAIAGPEVKEKSESA